MDVPVVMNFTMSANETYEGPTAWFLSEFWLFCFACTLSIIIAIGVVGNALVIYVSLRTCLDRGPTTTIDVYILHMSMADFLFLIFCVPFQGTVYILNDWPYGLSMCKVAHYCQYVTMYASIWILVLMSIDRYIAIGHPLKSVQWRSIERATRSSIAVWILAGLFSLPVLFLYTTVEYPSATACYDYWSVHIDFRPWFILIVFIISFLLPTFIIFCMALLVSTAIQTSVKHPLLHTNSMLAAGSGSWTEATSRRWALVDDTNRRRRKRVVWLVFALSAWYLFCWLPHSVLLVWLNFDPDALEWVEDNSWAFFLLKIVGHMGTYVHSCLNPILYSLAYEQFRRRLFFVFSRRVSQRRRSSRASAKMSYTYIFGGGSPQALSVQSTQDRRLGTRLSRV